MIKRKKNEANPRLIDMASMNRAPLWNDFVDDIA